MNNAELLNKVKKALGNVPSQLDDTITFYIDEVIQYLLSAGVPESYLDTTALGNINEKCVGVIARGVADLWNYGNGDTKLSEYFYQRADQLRHEVIVEDE